MFRKSIVENRLERKRKRCAAMRAAKERLRRERAKDCANWTQFSVQLNFAVSPDGKHVALSMPNGWYICASERTVRSKIAKAIYRKTELTPQAV